MFKLRTLAVAFAASATVALSAGTALATTNPVPTPTRTIGTPNPCPTIRTFAPTNGPTDNPFGSPGDQPTISPNFGVTPTNCPTPPPVVNPLRTERFVVQYAAVGLTPFLNRVVATGPVFGTGSNTQISNTQNRFDLPNVLRDVNVLNTGIAFPTINLRTCTASVDQNGIWVFNRGTGAFRNASGNGVFNLDGQWTFPFRGNVCSLSFVRGNPLLQRLITPTFTSIQVTGVGSARV